MRDDGFFFVTLLILNTPISLAELLDDNVAAAVANFWLGALAIIFVTVAINFLLRALPRVKRAIQAVAIILFAVHFAAGIFFA